MFSIIHTFSQMLPPLIFKTFTMNFYLINSNSYVSFPLSSGYCLHNFIVSVLRRLSCHSSSFFLFQMDKLDSFDVSELDSDRGFLASSSDEDDNTSKKHTPSLRFCKIYSNYHISTIGSFSHRLSALFHTEKSTNIDKKAVTSNPQSASTIYSAIVHLFVLQNGGYEGRGRCGVAVILQNDQVLLNI